MSPFDSQEYASGFFEPYASRIVEAIEKGFKECDDTHQLYVDKVRKRPVPFHPAYRTHFLHQCINQCLVETFEFCDDVNIAEVGGNIELLFQNRVRIKINKVNDDLSLCTNNGTGKEQAYRNPTSLGGAFGYGEVSPIYLGYRLRKTGELRDIKLIKYDHNERQWHVGIDGSNPDTVQGIVFDGPVTPIITPSEQPTITIKRTKGA